MRYLSLVLLLLAWTTHAQNFFGTPRQPAGLSMLETSTDGNFVAEGGSNDVRYYQSLLLSLGIEANAQPLTALSAPVNTLRFSAPAGNLRTFEGGELPAFALNLRVRGKAYQMWLRGTVDIAPNGAQIRQTYRDQQGEVWLTASHAHALLTLDVSPTLKLMSAELLIGPKLAQVLGDQRLDGKFIGVIDSVLPVQAGPRALRENSCAVPIWPSASLKADVKLTDLNSFQQMRCQGCDGPGGSEGVVVIAPNAVLKNIGNVDVPWYQKFLGDFPPYGNDQHPFLVWSMYRQDADGTLRMIGRSGVKHAFFAENLGCDCQSQGMILGRNCSDAYSAPTNDTPGEVACTSLFCFQGLRREIAPAQGVFGRCGSWFDPNCDADPADAIGYGPYENRMTVKESELSGPPGTRYFFDAWYLVRDDGNWINNIGTRELTPVFSSNIWIFHQNLLSFENGTILDRWNQDLPNGVIERQTTLESPAGRVQVSARAKRVGDRWRYQYTVFNADLMQISLAGTEPNVQITQSFGINSFRVNSAGTPANLADLRMIDLDDVAANDWNPIVLDNDAIFEAPAAVTQEWGSLYSFFFTSTKAPAFNATVELQLLGGPTFSADVLGPDGDAFFASGFE